MQFRSPINVVPVLLFAKNNCQNAFSIDGNLPAGKQSEQLGRELRQELSQSLGRSVKGNSLYLTRLSPRIEGSDLPSGYRCADAKRVAALKNLS